MSILDTAPVYITERPRCGALCHAVEQFFGHRLDRLHESPYFGGHFTDVRREEDQASVAHHQFYRLFPRIAVPYAQLAVACVREFVGEPCHIQAVPTFRVHFPNSRAVGEPHTDWQYGHQPGEVTCWLPLTPAYGSATVWVADRVEAWDPRAYEAAAAEEGAGRAPAGSSERVLERSLPPAVHLWPVNIEPPLMLVFDGVTRVHANLLNREGMEAETVPDEHGLPTVVSWSGRGVTRVSLDFRLLPARLADPATKRCDLGTGALMAPGGYWTEQVVDPAGAFGV